MMKQSANWFVFFFQLLPENILKYSPYQVNKAENVFKNKNVGIIMSHTVFFSWKVKICREVKNRWQH